MLSISSPILLSPHTYWPLKSPINCRPRSAGPDTYTFNTTLKRKYPSTPTTPNFQQDLHTPRPTKRLCSSIYVVTSDKGASLGALGPPGSPGSAPPLVANIPLNPIIPATPERLDPNTMSTSPSISIPHSDSATSSSTAMPPSRESHSPSQTLPPFLTMRRGNPKKLSLSLFVPPTPSSTMSDTPSTPGPPKTPALSMSMGRASMSKSGRPSLLSLITRESPDDIPPTPLRLTTPARQRPKRSRAQSDTTDATPYHIPPGSRSAQPTSLSFAPISETPEPDFCIPRESSPFSMSTSPSSSLSSLNSSSPSTSCSPPLRTEATFAHFSAEPYADGPIEVIPGVFLGSEEATYDLSWARGSRVRILNVASEIDDPFTKTHSSIKGKERQGSKLSSAHYEGESEIEYCHLSWSHGEEKLADLPNGVRLDDLLESGQENQLESWGFWHAIQWLESARRQGIPVLIHCQCGVSRSATLTIAYLMTLAAAGILPNALGHLKGMQDTYDMVKTKSPSIGPNVSLVFQLVEYQRNLTTLLSSHYARPSPRLITTSFPTAEDAALSEAEWARKRRELEDEDMDEIENKWYGVLGSPITPEEADDEARRWDDAMVQRRMGRVA